MNTNELIIREIIENRTKTRDDLAKIKRKIAKNYKIPCPDNISLLKTYHELTKKKKIKKSPLLELLLITRPIRSLSGIVNISVLTKPYPCPGQCLYCPKEKNIPKSYVSGEPAVERAKKLKYDPYQQTKMRIEMLEHEGHPTDKIELRIVGGTWSFYKKPYQEWFVKRCFDACNQKKSKTLEQAQRTNEKAKHRVVGLSIETRPDFINEKEIKRLRKLGMTMVELGVQSIYDDILKLNKRGHAIKETITATKLLKDAGFKVLFQMMPNLPGSNVKKDEKMFKELFNNQDFQPDLLKIYPCALLKEAPLYKLWKKKQYKPYAEKQLINLIKNIKKKIPTYIRIQRISRDIPSSRIVSGPAKISNIRQILKNQKIQCKCIRCREIRDSYKIKEELYLLRKDYKASGGKEIFLSIESKTKLYSLLRLRKTSKNQAIIRELHTFGQQLPINGYQKTISPQHQGLGKRLIKEAERITKKELKLKKISVISAVGTRNYFRKLNYKLENTYMVKNL